MWPAVVVVVMVVVVKEGGGVATPLRPPVSRYAGITSSKQTVLLDPSTKSPRPPPTSTPTPPDSQDAPGLTGVTGGGHLPQTARLREGRYPLRRVNSSGLSPQRLRQQKFKVKGGAWRRGSAGGLAMGGRRIRPGGDRAGGMTGPGKRRHVAGTASGGPGRWRNRQGHLRHRLAFPRASSQSKSNEFLSRWHDSYSVNHQQPSTTTITTAPFPSTPTTKSSIPKIPAPSIAPSVSPVIPVIAPSVHDMTSRHFTTSTNATSSPTRQGGGALPSRQSSASSSRRPSVTTPAPRPTPRATPGDTDILDSIQSIFKAAGKDLQSLASKKAVGNTAPPPLDVFAGMPATSDFRPNTRLEEVLKADPDPPAIPLNPVRLTPTLAPRGDPNLVPVTPKNPRPQSLTTGNYLVHVGRPPPAESREGGIVLSDEGDENDVVIGRPAALIQTPRDAQPRTSSKRLKVHTASSSSAHIDNYVPITTKAPAYIAPHSPTHGPAHGPAHAPAHVLTHAPTQRPTHGSAHSYSHVPAHVLTQFPEPQQSLPQVLLGSVPPWGPEDVRPLLDFIRNKYGEAVPRVPPSVTSLQALISSGRVPEMFRGPEVLQGIRRKAQVFRPLPLKRRGEALGSKTELLKKSQGEVEISSGGQFVALSSLALLVAFCGYLLFGGTESLSEPRGTTVMLVGAVEETKKGLNVLLQDLDEYEDHLKSRKEEEDVFLQRIKEETGPRESIRAILRKIWDVVVPPKFRLVSRVLSYLSGNLKLTNNSRTSKRLSSLFSKPDKTRFPSLRSLKENGLKFMNRIAKNGVEFLIKNLRDSGFDLIQVNQSDSNANSPSILTKDRISLMVHSLLDSLVNSESANTYLSRLWNPFEIFTSTRTNKTESVNQTTSSKPHQEPKNLTETMNLNLNARTQTSEPKQTPMNHKTLNPKSSNETGREPGNEGAGMTSWYSLEPPTGAKRPSEIRKENHTAMNQSELPNVEPKKMTARKIGEINKKNHKIEEEAKEEKEINEAEKEEVNEEREEDEDKDEDEEGQIEEKLEKILDNEAKEIIKSTEEREKQEHLNEEEKKPDQEREKPNNKETDLNQENRNVKNEEESNNMWIKNEEKKEEKDGNVKVKNEEESSNMWIKKEEKKEEKEDGNVKVNNPTEKKEVKGRVKVILNNLLHVERLFPSTSPSSSSSSSSTSSSSSSPSSTPTSSSSSSSSSSSRVSAFVDNIPLSPVTQDLKNA